MITATIERPATATEVVPDALVPDPAAPVRAGAAQPPFDGEWARCYYVMLCNELTTGPGR
jgi:hypothetical protein